MSGGNIPLRIGWQYWEMDYFGIPQIDAFCSFLKQETSSKEDYKHAIIIYKKLWDVQYGKITL